MHNPFGLLGSGPQRFPSLKTVSLMLIEGGGDGPFNWFDSIDTCFPGIENLILEGASFGILPGASTKYGNAELLPNLRNLALRDIMEPAQDELCDFITLHRAAGVALPGISFNSTSLVNMRRLDWLKTQVEVTERDPWLEQLGRSLVLDDLELSHSCSLRLLDE